MCSQEYPNYSNYYHAWIGAKVKDLESENPSLSPQEILTTARNEVKQI
jgi:hypothetical protein